MAEKQLHQDVHAMRFLERASNQAFLAIVTCSKPPPQQPH
jgi:hypothetical protein